MSFFANIFKKSSNMIHKSGNSRKCYENDVVLLVCTTLEGKECCVRRDHQNNKICRVGTHFDQLAERSNTKMGQHRIKNAIK